MATNYYYEVTADETWTYEKKSTDSTKVALLPEGTVVYAHLSSTKDGVEWYKIANVSVDTGVSQVSSTAVKNSYFPMSSSDFTKISKTEMQKLSEENDAAEEDDEDSYFNESLAAFTVTYDTYFSSSDALTTNTDSVSSYYSQLSEGLEVADLRGVLGIPHQFLPSTDPRISTDSEGNEQSEKAFGRAYAENIIQRIPLLLMTPGVANFMSSWNKAQRGVIYGVLGDALKDNETIESLLSGNSGKYYTLKYSYTDYFKYVNAMLRSAAFFLGIEDEEIDGTALKKINWLYAPSNDSNSDVFGHAGLSKFLGPYTGCVAFYVNPGNTVDDSFSNSTSQSALASAFNNLSDTGRELTFLVGSAGAATNLYDLDNISSSVDQWASSIEDTLGSSNIFSNILSKATTILSGGRLVFPEIWSDSSFGRSYSCSMKLVSPAGDKLSLYLNILVPIYHLMAFALPRQSDGQAYYSPFLIRGYCQGSFNVDMGIMTSLSISRGDEGEWSVDGIPTCADVSFEIKDLYDGMFISTQETDNDGTSILSNITELDYIANSCGVNVNDQEVMRTIRMAISLGFTTKVADAITIGIFGNIQQYFTQKMNDIFGVF